MVTRYTHPIASTNQLVPKAGVSIISQPAGNVTKFTFIVRIININNI